MLAITGITGRVGGRLANALLHEGEAIRAVVRDRQKGLPWSVRGCDVRVADVNDEAALTSAFTGAAGVFILLPPTFDPSPDFSEARRAIEAIRGALRAARPHKVVCLSTIGARAAEPNLLNQLGLLEAALETLPMPTAFLRAAWFIENSAWDIETARATGAFPSFLQPTDRPVPMVATADVAQVAAELLRETWSGRRVIELEGPERVSPDRIAGCLGHLLERDVVADGVPRAEWEAVFRAQGMRNPLPRMQMLDGFNAGWIRFDRRARKGLVSVEAVLQELVSLQAAATSRQNASADGAIVASAR